MTELMQEVLALREDVRKLRLLIMKDKNDTTWVSEEDAAAMLGYVDPRSLRTRIKKAKKITEAIKQGKNVGASKAVKHAQLLSLIGYRETNGRNYQYSRKGLMEFKKRTGTEA